MSVPPGDGRVRSYHGVSAPAVEDLEATTNPRIPRKPRSGRESASAFVVVNAR